MREETLKLQSQDMNTMFPQWLQEKSLSDPQKGRKVCSGVVATKGRRGRNEIFPTLTPNFATFSTYTSF